MEILGKYGACQVLAVDGKSICYVLLDYLEDALPGEDIPAQLKPYYRKAFQNHHQVAKTGIENMPVPRDYRYIGQCELKSDPVWNSYSWKWPSGEDYYYGERWKAFDENARSAYKKYINSGDFVSVHGRMFRKNTRGLRDELYQFLTEKDTLEEFPCITYAEVRGYSDKLEKLISTAPLLRTLRLQKAGVENLDLGKICPNDLELDMSGIRRLILPKDTRSLKLDRLSVTHLREDDWLRDNLDNPFRHWDGSEFIPGAAYRSARKCCKDTKKLLSEAKDRKEIEEIVRRYTRYFNKLNARYEAFIETEEREDIFMAMQKLYEECILHGECGQADETAAPLTLSQVWDVMDEVREDW